MKKLLLFFAVFTSLTSCEDNKSIEVVKSDLKTTDKLSDNEIGSTKFKTIKMLSSDGKKALIELSLDRKNIVASRGGLFASALDVCNDSEIKENTDVFYIESYRITKDTVFKKIYFINENKIVGKFRLK